MGSVGVVTALAAVGSRVLRAAKGVGRCLTVAAVYGADGVRVTDATRRRRVRAFVTSVSSLLPHGGDGVIADGGTAGPGPASTALIGPGRVIARSTDGAVICTSPCRRSMDGPVFAAGMAALAAMAVGGRPTSTRFAGGSSQDAGPAVVATVEGVFASTKEVCTHGKESNKPGLDDRPLAREWRPLSPRAPLPLTHQG